MQRKVEIHYVNAEINIQNRSLKRHSTIKDLSYAYDCEKRSHFVRSLRSNHDPFAINNTLFLVPDTPIKWPPSLSFWSRVADLPSVQFNGGFWKLWDFEELPDVVANADANDVSVYVVPESQYQQLNLESDVLTELRQPMINAIKPESPFVGASPSQFQRNLNTHPFYFGRPKHNDRYAIPLSLLQPEFGHFQDDLRSIPLDPTLTSFGVKFIFELAQFFNDEAKRESALHQLLEELFGSGVSVMKRKIDSFTTDGGAVHDDLPDLSFAPLITEVKKETTAGGNDAVFEIMLYYINGVAALSKTTGYGRDPREWGARNTRLPSILIVHNGPNIQVFGAVCLEKGLIEVLSQSIPLYFNPYNTQMMEDFLRFLAALRKLFWSLFKLYQNPHDHAVDANQIYFPYPHSYTANVPPTGSGSPNRISFVYMERVSSIRLVFEARTAHGDNIFVKFGTHEYGVDAHIAAANEGLAPKLLSYSHLAGSMWMIVMQPLDAGFQSCGTMPHLPGPCQDAIKNSLVRFHTLGFVHGDLRDSNWFVKQSHSGWECQLIDFDWAGRSDTVRYPIGVYNHEYVWRPRAHMDGDTITMQDDYDTTEQFLKSRTAMFIS